MAPIPYRLLRPALFALDPEVAHDWTINILARTQHTPLRHAYAQPWIADPCTLAGLHFPNRVGMAAGLDKNARVIDGLGAMGFGFVEVGTVTPRAQSGNPKPRMFRLPEHQALINRLGFNNQGLEVFLHNVARARFRQSGRILGLNIGKNADTPIENALNDYLLGLHGVYPHADYITINISSPNTSNLRSLQSDEALHALLDALTRAQGELANQHGKMKPLFVKIAPDLDDAQITAMAQTLKTWGCDDQGRAHGRLGLICTNTTLARESVAGHRHAQEAGGLSGGPVRGGSTRILQAMRRALGADFPIMGVGGIVSGADARAKIDAGADVVQIYTGLIYRGPALVRECAQALCGYSSP